MDDLHDTSGGDPVDLASLLGSRHVLYLFMQSKVRPLFFVCHSFCREMFSLFLHLCGWSAKFSLASMCYQVNVLPGQHEVEMSMCYYCSQKWGNILFLLGHCKKSFQPIITVVLTSDHFSFRTQARSSLDAVAFISV